jgi:hypothetical protein
VVHSITGDGPEYLEALADAYAEYSGVIRGADRATRMRLMNSVLEGMWSDSVSTFASGGANCAPLLLLILDRIPEDRIPDDVAQMLFDDWLRSSRSAEARSWMSSHLPTDRRLQVIVNTSYLWEVAPGGR